MQIFVEEDAEADLSMARDWYDAERLGLGDEFLAEFQMLTDRILGFPKIYRTVLEDIRQAAMNRFPYYVFYIVEDDLISITAVIHKHRDPDVWQQRAR